MANKMTIKLYSQVIVKENSKAFIGKVTGTGYKNRRRTFDVLLESGRELIFVPVDTLDKTTYIDSNLTKRLLPSIEDSRIDVQRRGNYKK